MWKEVTDRFKIISYEMKPATVSAEPDENGFLQTRNGRKKVLKLLKGIIIQEEVNLPDLILNEDGEVLNHPIISEPVKNFDNNHGNKEGSKSGTAPLKSKQIQYLSDHPLETQSKGKRYKCHYKGCDALATRLFSFPTGPKNKERQMAWIVNTGRKEYAELSEVTLRNRRICGLHFRASDFNNSKRDKLIHSAVPLPWCEPEEEE